MELAQCTDIGCQTQAQANDLKVFISATKKNSNLSTVHFTECTEYEKSFWSRNKKNKKKTSSSAGILNRLLFGRPGPGI